MLSFRISWALAALVLAGCGGTSIGTVPGDDGTGSRGPSGSGVPSDTPQLTSPPSVPPNKPASPSDDDGTPTTPPTKPPTCTAVVNDATAIAGVSKIAAAAPTPTGGAIVDGKYHLTSAALYTGVGGDTGIVPITIKQTFVLHGTSADLSEDANGVSLWGTFSFLTAGDTATFGQTCPSTEPPTIARYSATPASLVLFLPNDAGQIVAYTYEP